MVIDEALQASNIKMMWHFFLFEKNALGEASTVIFLK
jgi:hypothetical protein